MHMGIIRPQEDAFIAPCQDPAGGRVIAADLPGEGLLVQEVYCFVVVIIVRKMGLPCGVRRRAHQDIQPRRIAGPVPVKHRLGLIVKGPGGKSIAAQVALLLLLVPAEKEQLLRRCHQAGA